MSTNIFLGYPPENIKQFIIENYRPKDMTKVPLTFTAEEPNATFCLKPSEYGSPTVTLETLRLSENDDWTTFSDDDWQEYNVGDEITLINVGDKIMFRNSSDNIQVMGTDESEYNRFDISKGKIAASGNIIFLMDKTGELRDLSGKDFCYSNMFFGCSSLTQAPILPATTLSYGCYQRMFFGCSSLTQAPALPATELTERCYECMFYGCASLTQAPTLPAEILIRCCYEEMFSQCSSLTNAYFPNLNSETVIDEVVGNQGAFYGAAANIETQCSDKILVINSTSV